MIEVSFTTDGCDSCNNSPSFKIKAISGSGTAWVTKLCGRCYDEMTEKITKLKIVLSGVHE